MERLVVFVLDADEIIPWNQGLSWALSGCMQAGRVVWERMRERKTNMCVRNSAVLTQGLSVSRCLRLVADETQMKTTALWILRQVHLDVLGNLHAKTL